MESVVVKKSKAEDEELLGPAHPAAILHKLVTDDGGTCEPRSMGFKMTDSKGGRLGFCVPKQEGFEVYLTTFKMEDQEVVDLGEKVAKGNSGIPVLRYSNPEKAYKRLKKLYASKPKKTVKRMKQEDLTVEKPKKSSQKSAKKAAKKK